MPIISSIPTRWLVAALVAAIALGNGAGLALASTPPRAVRADVRHLLAPVHRLNRAINARRGRLDQLTSTWSGTAEPCIDSAYAGVDQQVSQPLEHRLGTLQQSYATMRVKTGGCAPPRAARPARSPPGAPRNRATCATSPAGGRPRGTTRCPRSPSIRATRLHPDRRRARRAGGRSRRPAPAPPGRVGG